MGKTYLVSALLLLLFVWACSTEEEGPSERFRMLTGVVWQSDSLLVAGRDAGGPGELLAAFRGEARFREDGTGYFGQFQGRWRFAMQETQVIIESDSLLIPVTARIAELTEVSLKIETAFPNPELPEEPHQIRMTFIPK